MDKGTCCLILSVRVWVVLPTYRASHWHLNSSIILLSFEAGRTSFLTAGIRRREVKNHSWTNSQIRVRDASFDLFLISLRNFPFPRNLDGDRALFRTHFPFIYSSEEFVHKPPDDTLRISILTKNASNLVHLCLKLGVGTYPLSSTH